MESCVAAAINNRYWAKDVFEKGEDWRKNDVPDFQNFVSFSSNVKEQFLQTFFHVFLK